jgi:CheY-like chemotaxis protein
MSTEPLELLLADDDDGHAFLVERTFERAGIVNRIVRAHDGQEALDYVYCRGKFAERKTGAPLLLLLDINMPRVDGVEVLEKIKSNEATTKLPVIMLTTTDDPREIQRCYQLGCNVYVTKPVEYDNFVEAVKRLGLFLQVVQLPNES